MTTLQWPRARTHHLSRRQASQFMADVDSVWLCPESPVGGEAILAAASTSPPRAAAESLLEQMGHAGLDADLASRFGMIGVAVGTLTPNLGHPKGVRAIWRSTLPVVLVTKQVPRRSSRTWEVSEQLGHLIYGTRRDESTRVPLARTFAHHFEKGLVGI